MKMNVHCTVLVFVLVSSSCRSTSEYNPFVDMSDYRIAVIEDFEGPNTTGYEFAERIGRALSGVGVFDQILREKPEGKAIRIRGKITRYSRGNPAMRLRYGHNIGNARFTAVVRVEDFATGDYIATIELNETYDTSIDRSLRTQHLDTLLERAAMKLAEELAGDGL